MRGALYLALKHLAASRVQSAILILCFALAAGLPMAGSMLLARYETSLRERAERTPLVAGARGSRFDLVLSTTHFRRADVPESRRALVDRISRMRLGLAIPMHVGFTARNHPVVGTSVEYGEFRRFSYEAGGWPVGLGEAVLGANVAKKEQLGVEDRLYSDQPEVYDIAKPPAIRLRIVGVLERTGTPDDDAVFVDIATAWLMAGIVHGHDPAEQVRDSRMILQRDGSHTSLSGAIIEYNEVTPETAGQYHLHADPQDLPLTSVLVVPRDQKSATILSTEVNLSKTEQMVVPSRVVDELLAYVVKIKSLVDGISAAMIAVNVLLTGLIVAFSIRSRERERQTLHRIGCDRMVVPMMFASEVAVLIGAGVGLAGLGALLLARFAPDIVAML